jgi:hypothetical protein
MKVAEQRLEKERRERAEAAVARHIHELFERLPVLSGFFLGTDFRLAELAISTWTGCTADVALYEDVMQAFVDLAEERPEAVHLIGGRTYARAVH